MPRNEYEAHRLLATPRTIPAWQKPAPVRATAKPSTLRRILRAVFGV
jgi:hypothetical protein